MKKRVMLLVTTIALALSAACAAPASERAPGVSAAQNAPDATHASGMVSTAIVGVAIATPTIDVPSTATAMQATVDAAVASTMSSSAAQPETTMAEPSQAPSTVTLTALPPTATATATVLPSPTACRLTLTTNLNAFVREGPDVNYAVIGALQAGESAEVIGRDAAYGWWVIPFDGRHGWVSGSVVTLSDCAIYPPEVTPPPTPIPAATATATATPPPSIVVIDLLALASQARWETAQLLSDGHNGRDVTRIPFQGSGSAGSASLGTRDLEDGTTQYALRTHPKWVDDGTIKGWFPWVTLPPNAVFQAGVGFMSGAGRSDGVTFWVWEHHIENGREVWNPVARVDKAYDGRLVPLWIDLSHLAGQSVSIELRVDAGASSGQDWAVWVAPRIVGN